MANMIKVQKILLESTLEPHWIVIGSDFMPIEPISEFLMFFRNTGKSIYTIRTYAHHLKIFWEYLETKQLQWSQITIDELAYFVATLNGLIHDNVVYLKKETCQKRSARTINQIVNAVASFYQFQHRLGHVSDLSLTQLKKVYYNHNSFKPFLYHLNRSPYQKRSVLKLKETKHLPQVISSDTIKKMLTACKRLRDKLLICLLYETGCRIGQALGLRHEDIESFNNTIIIRPRDDNANLARAKTHEENVIHVSPSLMQLYSDYYLYEYANVDSDYVFINLWHGEIGHPITYNSVITLFQRLSKKLNIHVTPHMLRHTHATDLIQAGWSMAAVQKRLGHQDVQTTINTYTHLTDQDLKKQYQDYLEKRGNL